MCRSITILTSVVLVCGLMTTASNGQLLGLYEFDGGGDGTSWDEATNWNVILNPDGTPNAGGDPATPPDAVTSADVPLTGVVIDGTMPGQTARNVAIGTANGVGSLNMSGGDITLLDLNIGADGVGANAGSLDLSGGTLVAGDDITVGAGSVGTMTMSGGAASTNDDFNINIDSSLTMTGGTIFVGDRLNMLDNASLDVDGGEITADDDFFFFGDSQITVDSGSMIVFDKMRFDDDPAKNGKLTINGGFVRSQEFHFNIVDILADFRGVVEINGDGFYDSEAPGPTSPLSQLSVGLARTLIAQGIHFITSEAAPKQLGAFSVVVPEFDGRTDVVFTRISVVPEPASLVLLGLGALGLVLRRRRA